MSDIKPPPSGWVKSSLSFANGNCVEVSHLPEGVIGVRNSRDPSGPVLRFTPDEWHAFLGGARNGEFDHFGESARDALDAQSLHDSPGADLDDGACPDCGMRHKFAEPGQ
jgi:hypothetical protein